MLAYNHTLYGDVKKVNEYVVASYDTDNPKVLARKHPNDHERGDKLSPEDENFFYPRKEDIGYDLFFHEEKIVTSQSKLIVSSFLKCIIGNRLGLTHFVTNERDGFFSDLYKSRLRSQGV